MPKKKKSNKIIWILSVLFMLILSIGGYIVYDYYLFIYQPIKIENNGKYIYIPTGSTLEQLADTLISNKLLKPHHKERFFWLAEKKNLTKHIHPGRYLITDKTNLNQIINLIRSGNQAPVDITIFNVRLIDEIVPVVCTQLETDSLELYELLHSDSVARKYGFNLYTFPTMFIPNTYRFNWNTNASEFIERMAREYKNFWNDERKQKARALGLSQSEVSILASIVQKETKMNDEKPVIAGVYYNRLKKGMLLQADPTLIFAAKDFTIKRVLNKHKEIDSPYNTYKYKGLPPGPICLPEISSIDAVLNLQKHEYLYFCAKEDFSGYHNFAKTYAEHKKNARRFQQALNRLRVYK